MPMLFAILVTVAAPAHHPDWMVGRWQLVGRSESPKTACDGDGGDSQLVYSPRGYWLGIAVGDYGRWWIAGDTLFRKTLDPGDGGAKSARGGVTRNRVRRVRDGLLRVDGGGWFVRCDREYAGWAKKGVRF